MKRVLTMALVVLMLAGLTGCLPVASPAIGVFYTDVKYGDLATTSTAAAKEGKACAQSIMGLVASGDASVAAAKAAGGITEVSQVDHSATSVLGIIGEWCTIVKGK